MRNLKRALSLALASVMLLGMMVVGTSAASYPDVDENDNVEAIEVLNAVNVMIGDRGNFRPDAAVNRHEMATIMAKLVLGVETADNYVGTHPFTDVFPWADKYVAACYENGLVAGTSATTFGGNQPLTAVQAAAMMLRALGYKDLSKGATDWRAPVTAMANQIRLFSGVASNPSEQLTRNQVAQLALNTLKSPMVNLKDNTFDVTNGEGNIVISGGSREYIALSSNEAYAKAINDTERAGTSASQISGYTVELGEHLYNGKLKLNNNNLDVFGRPSRRWEFDGKEIGSYIKEELMVMDKVGKVTGNDLYTLLGASTIKDYDTLVTIDGVDNQRNDAKDILKNPGAYFDATDMNRNNKEKVGETGTGVLTQVFVDHEKDEVYVAIINTYLARASRDYDDKGEEATLTVYGIDEYRTTKEYVKTAKQQETMKVQDEDFTLVKDVKKDDPYLVTVADGEIQTMVPAEVLEAVTLSAFKRADHVVSGGTEYAYTTTATFKDGDLDNYTGIAGNTNLKDMTYNIYLDAYGNLIGIEEVDAVKNYVFLAGIDVDGSNLYSKTATANALFLDGTSKTIKIDLSKSDWTVHKNKLDVTNVVISGDALLNTWCTYTVSGDMYTVKEVHATAVNPDENPGGNTLIYGPNNYPQPNATGTVPNNTKLAQSWQAMTNTGKVSVKNLRLDGGGASGSAFANVYGDSTSVYLTANLDELYNDKGSTSYGIIKDVDSVTTGVADTSIEIWTRPQAVAKAEKSINQPVGALAYGVYTLYDNDGIVIAAVVIGENEGVKDLVYVHSSGLDLESYSSEEDTWTWTRKVIFNGQEVTLTEKGDAVSDLEQMKRYQWYEIKRNANGEIIDADPAWNALGSYLGDTDSDGDLRDETGEFVADYSKINERVEYSSKDTILYQTEGGPNDYTGDPAAHAHIGLDKDLRVIGSNTLAVETLTGSGIHFRDNVNVVLQYYNQNTRQVEVETGTGVDRLKSMVDFVNDNNDTGRIINGVKYNYYLSALIEKGFATTIVIYDEYNNYNKPETEVSYVDMPSTSTIADVNAALVDNNVRITGAWQPNDLVAEAGDRLNTVRIPANRTLYIDGNFIAYQNGTTNKGSIYVTPGSSSTSKLIVNGNAYLAGQQLDCNTEVRGSLTINTAPDAAGITYLNANFKVTGNMIVSNVANGTNVRVTSGSTVVVDGNLSSRKAGVTVDVYGHMEIGNDAYDGITTFPIHYDVLSSSTLEAGTLYGTFCVGDSSRTGRVVVDTLRTTAATGAHTVGANLNRGTLEINGTNYTTGFNIGNGAPKILFGDKAADAALVFVTDTGAQAVVSGKTYTFTRTSAGNVNVTVGNDTTIIDTIIGDTVSKVEDNTATAGDPVLTVTGGTIAIGGKLELKPVLTPADETVKYTYASDKTDIATVDAQGVVTGVAAGTANITVTATKDGKTIATATAQVTVSSATATPITKVEITGVKLSYPAGTTELDTTVNVATTPANGATAALVWGAIADGKATGTITLTPAENFTFDANCEVTVNGTAATMTDGKITVEATVAGSSSSDNIVKATVTYDIGTDSYAATFSAYLGDKTSITLTDEEIAAALTEAGYEATKDDVDMDAKTVATSKGTVSFASNVVTSKLFKVTYPGNTTGVYLPAGGGVITGVTTGVLALIPDSLDLATVAQGAVVPAEGVWTIPAGLTKDTNYAKAYELDNFAGSDGIVKAGAAHDGNNIFDAKYIDADGLTQTLVTNTAMYIQDGKSFKLSKAATNFNDVDNTPANALAEGRTISVTVNGGTAEKVTVGANGAIADKTITVTGVNASASNKVTLTVAVDDPTYEIYLNGSKWEKNSNDKYVVTGKTGMTLAYMNDEGVLTDSSLDLTSGQAAFAESAVNTAAGTEAVDGKLDLWTAYSVTTPAADGNWSAWKDEACTETQLTAGAATLVKAEGTEAERTIYIKAKVAGMDITYSDFTHTGDAIKAPGARTGVVGIWKCVVSKTIIATDLIPAVTATKATLDAGVDLAANLASTKITKEIGGLVLANGVTVTGKSFEPMEDGAGMTFTVDAKVKDNTKVEMEITGDDDTNTITKGAAGEDKTVGVLTVNLSNGWTVRVAVVINGSD